MKLYHGSTVTVKSPNIQKGVKLLTLEKDSIRQLILNRLRSGQYSKGIGNMVKKRSFQFMKSPIIFLIESFQSFDLMGLQKSGWSL